MGWNFYNASGELQINDGGVQASAAVFTGNVDLGSNLLVGNDGSTGIAISANGEVTMAAQPAVLAFNSANDLNVTGNGTTVTVDFNSEVFDQNSDFASDTFTAPVTGRYLVNTVVRGAGMTSSAGNFIVGLVASNRTWNVHFGDSGPVPDILSYPISTLLDMDDCDTVYVTLFVNGEGSDVVDIDGSSTMFTTLSVSLEV